MLFLGSCDTFFQYSLINKKLKEQHLFKILICCNYIVLFKTLGSVFFFPFFIFINKILLFSKDLLNWYKVKTCIVIKDFYFEQMLFFLTINHQKSWKVSKYEASQLFPTLIINQHIRNDPSEISDTEVMMLNIQLCITRINYILKYITVKRKG